MKRWLAISIVVLLGGVVLLVRLKSDRPPEVTIQPELATDVPDVTTKDGDEVFRRAFWRRPMSEDRIVHAERHEWFDESRVERWAWFLEVEASDELRAHLIERNAFDLRPLESVTLAGPWWFPSSPEGMRIMGSADGDMCVLWREGSERLYATGSGGGFNRAVEAPGPFVSEVDPVAGRLPDSPPPTPSR